MSISKAKGEQFHTSWEGKAEQNSVDSIMGQLRADESLCHLSKHQEFQIQAFARCILKVCKEWLPNKQPQGTELFFLSQLCMHLPEQLPREGKHLNSPLI